MWDYCCDLYPDCYCKHPKGNHVQCKLKRYNQITYTWLPEEFAVVGKFIDLKEGNDWEHNWQVVEIYSTRDSQTILNRWAQDRGVEEQQA